MKKIIMFSAALIFGATLSAQNLNPEVQVTNDYVSNFSEMPKQGISMAVPDSLHRFDYHFDYNVFDSPYKGAYEFSPYSVSIKPDPAPFGGKTLYASIGAGYTLHPELDVVWTPVRGKCVALSFVEKARGFYGSYRTFDKDFAVTGTTGNGEYDFSNHTALDGRLWFGRSALKFDLGYDGLFTSTLYGLWDNCHSAFAAVRLKPNSDASNRFYYELGLNYRLSRTQTITDNNIFVDGKLGGEFSRRRISCLLDYNLALNSFYRGFDLAPHADFSFGPVGFKAGLRMGIDRKRIEESRSSLVIYPDLTASINIVKDYLQMILYATGGPRYNSYFGFKSSDHRFSCDTLGVTKDKLDVGGGLRGQISSTVQYSVKAGYKIMRDAALYTLDPLRDGVSGYSYDVPYRQSVGYVDYNSFYVDASLLWKSERIDADASFLYLSDNLPVDSGFFAPAPLSGGVHFTCNWGRRFFFGVGADAASARTTTLLGNTLTIPGYVDLGTSLEFKFARGWSVWLKGGNLLNMDIRRTPLYGEYGICATAGVRLSL